MKKIFFLLFSLIFLMGRSETICAYTNLICDAGESCNTFVLDTCVNTQNEPLLNSSIILTKVADNDFTLKSYLDTTCNSTTFFQTMNLKENVCYQVNTRSYKLSANSHHIFPSIMLLLSIVIFYIMI